MVPEEIRGILQVEALVEAYNKHDPNEPNTFIAELHTFRSDFQVELQVELQVEIQDELQVQMFKFI